MPKTKNGFQAQWDAEVKRLVAEGRTRHQAISQLRRDNPELWRNFLVTENSLAGRRHGVARVLSEVPVSASEMAASKPHTPYALKPHEIH